MERAGPCSGDEYITHELYCKHTEKDDRDSNKEDREDLPRETSMYMH